MCSQHRPKKELNCLLRLRKKFVKLFVVLMFVNRRAPPKAHIAEYKNTLSRTISSRSPKFVLSMPSSEHILHNTYQGKWHDGLQLSLLVEVHNFTNITLESSDKHFFSNSTVRVFSHESMLAHSPHRYH